MKKQRKDLGQGPRSINEIRIAGDHPRGEDTKFLIQKKKIFKALSGPPKTMLEVSAITGIERANICWFIREFRLNNSVRLINTGICSISRCKAGRWSTNPRYWKSAARKEVQHV